MSYQKTIRPKLEKLRDRLNLLVARYHRERPFEKGDADSRLMLLQRQIAESIEKLDEEMEEIIDSNSFLKGLSDQVDDSLGLKKKK